MMAIDFDPLKKHGNLSKEYIMEMMGMIPTFIHTAVSDPDSSLADGMMEAYGFGGPPMKGSTVSPEGVYSYPEDPDLFPLAVITTERGQVFIYHYGIVTIREPDKDDITYRMD